MIVTVTPNTTIDQTVVVAGFKKDSTMRAVQTVQSMGGKPADASFILGEIGIPSLALGFAAGSLGQKVEALLRGRGVITDFIQVDGESRLNLVIIDRADGTSSTITSSTLQVSADHVDALVQRCAAALVDASCMVLGGVLPTAMEPSFYARVIEMARQRGVPVIFDASEPYLSAGLHARPTFIKPNRDELAGLVGHPISSLDQAYQAGCEILSQYGTSVIITLGGDGALAVLPQRSYQILPLPVEVVSPNGAGDAVLAGLAAALEREQPVEQGLRLGFAAATAVLLQLGTADCRRADVEHFLPQIQLLPYPGA
ncbi:MAG TPA: hexose kinase [Aggregatilineaceae bacterium]|nr:hexose kinase [Aggregatilineaceae bacterium]